MPAKDGEAYGWLKVAAKQKSSGALAHDGKRR